MEWGRVKRDLRRYGRALKVIKEVFIERYEYHSAQEDIYALNKANDMHDAMATAKAKADKWLEEKGGGG